MTAAAALALPARPSRGPLAGEAGLSLEIAGVRSRWVFAGEVAAPARAFARRLRDFRSARRSGPSDLSFVVLAGGPERGPLPAPRHPGLRAARRHFRQVSRRFPHGDPGTAAASQVTVLREAAASAAARRELDRFAESGDAALLQVTSRDLVFVYPEEREVRIVLGRAEAGETGGERALRSALYFAHAVLLPRFGGVLLHAVAVRSGDGAHVFMGYSGSGKTTLARLLRPRGVLADDGAAVRMEGGRFLVYATPWQQAVRLAPGALRRARRGLPLRRLFVLEQGPRHSLARIPRAEAMAGALRSFVHCLRHMDAPAVTMAFDVARRLFSATPCHRLRFRRDAGFWPAIDAPRPGGRRRGAA